MDGFEFPRSSDVPARSIAAAPSRRGAVQFGGLSDVIVVDDDVLVRADIEVAALFDFDR